MRILICYKTYYELMKEIVKQCQRKFSEWQEEHEMFNLHVSKLGAVSLLYNHFLGCFTPLGG